MFKFFKKRQKPSTNKTMIFHNVHGYDHINGYEFFVVSKSKNILGAFSSNRFWEAEAMAKAKNASVVKNPKFSEIEKACIFGI